MENGSRVKKTMLNAKMNLICYFASFITAFFTRKILLDQLGAEFIGFTGTVGSLLSFLNLAELGIGTAIGYVLYKPIASGDKFKINEIISVLGYLYHKIGYVILSIGFITSLFLPLIFPNTTFSWTVIYFGFYAYLASSLIGYFMNYRAALLTADQRNYVVTGYFQLATTSKVILQMILALYLRSFTVYLSVELLFGIINSVILNWKINKTYPWLKSEVKQGYKLFKKYPEVVTYTKQIFAHRVGGVVQGQLTPFLIYSFVSLPVVALYTNYTLLTQKIESLVSATINSTGAAVGNLIAEGDKEKILKVFEELLALRVFIALIVATCIFQFSSQFIGVWLGEQYILESHTVAIIAILCGLNIARGVLDQFCYGSGLFADVWAPYAESAIMVLFSVVGGYTCGLSGVLWGPLASITIIIYIWKPYYLFSRGFKTSVVKYWQTFGNHALVSTVIYLVSSYLYEETIKSLITLNGWSGFIIEGVLFLTMLSALAFVCFYLTSKGFRDIVCRIKFSKR